MFKATKPAQSSLRLPRIDSKVSCNSFVNQNKSTSSEFIDQRQDDSMQVSKLQQWTLNKPNKKSRMIVNTHNISFLYRNETVRQTKNHSYGNNYKFMDIQLFVAKIDNQLQKIGDVNYFSIYKNPEYCSGVYENFSNTLLKTIAKHRQTIQSQLDQIQLKLQTQRQQHLKKVNELQSNNNQSYKDHINQVRETLQQKQAEIKPLKKMLSKIDATRTKVLKYCLSLGYDVRQEGLIWIIKELGVVPRPQEFPCFLTNKQINFIITKYMNEQETSNAQNLMKSQICGKTINEAYEYVNRRKRRQLSFIKQTQELNKLYTNRIKDYSREKHSYLSDSTLQIAQQIQKEKPKPTRYEVIYKQTCKKLNKICREKIHPQIYGKSNKQNKNSTKQQSKEGQRVRRKEKKKSTIIIEQFSRMLDLSISQSKKIDQIYTKEEKEFQQILREIRNEKYSEGTTLRNSINKFDQNFGEQKLRNPLSILSCLVGWRKAEKIIEQEMLSF